MKIIYKYEIKNQKTQRIKMPIGSKILDIQAQNNAIFQLWALVDTDKSLEEREIFMVYTGEEFDEYFNHALLDHISTVQRQGYVYHFFENRTPF